MKEFIFFLCTMNPCIIIPGEHIMMVPNPWAIDFYTHPDDTPLFDCPDSDWKIKWAHPVRGV